MRTKFSIAAAAAAALVSTAAVAQNASDSRWYVRGDTGGTFGSRIDGAGGSHSSGGWTYGAGVGRDFGNGWRFEGQVLHLDNYGAPARGDTKVWAGFANGYYDFRKGSAWQPFVGAGVGVAQVDVRGGAAPIRGRDTRFAYQAQAGLAHPFSPHLTGEIAYRYLGVPDADIGSGPKRIEGDYGASAVTVGLRYNF